MNSSDIPVGAPGYTTQREAFRRVEQLKAIGIWPGVRHEGTTYRLTYDPLWPRMAEDSEE